MLDTHAAFWLFEGELRKLSPTARRLIDREAVSISPIVLLEIDILNEGGRIRRDSREVLRYLNRELDIDIANDRISDIVTHALPLAFTRDPFDRLIVAHASLQRATLISCDNVIGANYADTVA
jgi:PIN domain nuclease of toxin-antitoxin system